MTAVPDGGRFPPAATGGRLRLLIGCRRGLREGGGRHPLDGALCSDPRVASSTIVRRGAWKPSPKGLDSGRAAGRAVPVRRPHGTTRRSPTHSLGGAALRSVTAMGKTPAEPDEPGRPPTAVREPSTRPRGGIHRRPRRAAGARRQGAIRGRGRFPQNGPPPSDFNDRFEASRGSEMVAFRTHCSARRCAILRSKGRILYDSCEGVPGNLAEGTRLRSSGRSCGACQAAPRDYQAQSHPLSPHGRG